jgi:hypothetical protein
MINKQCIRAAGLAVAVAFATPAFAGGVTVSDTEKGKLKLGGKAFISATNTTTKVPGTPNTSAKSFNIDRFYIEAKYYIDDTWMARFTTDVNNETPVAGLKRKSNIFLKYAYIEGKFSDALQLRLGLSHTPWIDYEQHLWGHRYVAKVASDHYKFDDSADYGVGLKGKLADGMVNYWVTASNGGGYGNPTNTNNTFDYAGRVSLAPVEGADISVGYRTGYRANALAASANLEKLIELMASYGNKQWRLGAGYMNRKTGTINTSDDKTMSVWGWAKFADKFGGFARYDDNKAKPFAAATYNDKRYVVGAEYFAAHGMSYSLAWTGTNNTNTNTKVDVIGIYSQFKW